MEKTRKGIMVPRVLHIVGVLLTSMAVGGCSKPPTALSEAELLTLLAAAKREGPYQFQRQTWPQLEQKSITYCGQLDEVTTAGADTLLLLKVNKQHNGEPLPWFLEGKSASPDLARDHKPGDTVCMAGTFASFMERDNVYWGYIKISSLTKPSAP